MPTDLKSFDAWKDLIFGTYSISTILRHVKDPDWQRVRISMLQTSLEFKRRTLDDYLGEAVDSNDLWRRQVRVTNYVYALKRGGLIK